MSAPTEYQWVITASNYDADPKFPRFVRFDGVDDYLNLPYMGLYAGGSASVVAGVYVNVKTSDKSLVNERSTLTMVPVYFPDRVRPDSNYSDTYIRNDASTVLLDSSDVATHTGTRHITSVVDSGSVISKYLNSGKIVDIPYTRTGVLTLNNTTIGASVSQTTTQFSDMNLYSLIITKSALSDAQRIKCERYAAIKAGVTL